MYSMILISMTNTQGHLVKNIIAKTVVANGAIRSMDANSTITLLVCQSL